MNTNCRWGFHFGLALATALLASALSNSAFAYTPEQEQACTPDAMRLCSAYIPDVDRITACMIARKSQLSPDCRRFFRAPEPVARKPAARKKPKKPAAT